MNLAWASDLPKELVHALRQREQFYLNRRIVYVMKEQTNLFQPSQESEAIDRVSRVEILRDSEAVKVTHEPIKTEDMVLFHKDTTGVVGVRKDGRVSPSVSCYVGPEGYANTGYSYFYDERSKRVSATAPYARIGLPDSEWLYTKAGSSLPPVCTYVSRLRGVMLIGLDVSKVYKSRWVSVEERADRWIMVGKIRATDYYDPPVPSAADLTLKVELLKPDAVIDHLELEAPPRSPSGMHYRQLWRTIQSKQVDSIRLPSVIEQVDTVKFAGNLRRKTTWVWRLERFEPLQKTVKLELAKNSRIRDERLGGLTYIWEESRMPSLAEAKQRATEAGQLVPPETPRRRYSVVLFLPAVLFFAGALYLYWKQRRQ